MGTSSYNTFKAMFYALDAVYDENKNPVLRSYLTKANPFLFADEGSADPAVYEAFMREYDLALGSDASPEDAMRFVRAHLKGESEDLLEAFDKVADAESWKDTLRSI